MNATAKTISLRDWNNEQQITYLWIAGVGCPAGKHFYHTDPEIGNYDDDEDGYCDFAELYLLETLWDLEGTIEDGQWCWNGEGNPTDERGNTIYNVKASREDTNKENDR